MPVGQFVTLLLVEDNPGDIRLVQETFRTGPEAYDIHVAEDGQEALDFLRRRPPFEKAPRPDIILLDLNLPRKNGREVLADIKADEDLKTIPVIILTTSDAEQDIQDTYMKHANCYITKPAELDDFIRSVNTLKEFWLSIVSLPNKEK
jgi:two-component system, chemotaxis family, response regulator Rcp1